jgi:3-oxoacyl-[acyl-carrier protein] reductase
VDNCVVITGASKGIGLAAARRFLDADFRVVNLSRSECPERRVAQLHVDMAKTDWSEVHSAALQALVGEPDRLIVIHNAALLKNDSIQNVEPAFFQQVLQLNVIAPSQLNQLLLPRMKTGSAILYLGSTLSEKAVPNCCSYVTSKHAVVGLMRSTCQDLAGSGVHTACICPGFTATEMLLEHVGQSEEVLAAIAAGVTFNRLIKPEEIAAALFFAAGNPVINGAVLHANLGQIER